MCYQFSSYNVQLTRRSNGIPHFPPIKWTLSDNSGGVPCQKILKQKRPGNILKFKLEAVKLTLLYDYKVKDVTNSLGIHRCMLSRWLKEFREGTLHGDGKHRLEAPTKRN